MIAVSRRAGQATESVTMAIANHARTLKARGIDVISLSVGEPDFDTPPAIKEAAFQAIREGRTGYPPSQGIPALRQAVADRFRQTRGLDCAPEAILISNGAKHAIHNALAALCDPDDEVIVPSPYWLSYPDLCRLVGARPVIVETHSSDGFKLRAETLRQALTPRTRVLILNSPNNPTGAVYSRQELAGLAPVILEANLAVISDEVYEDIVFPPARFQSLAAVHPELRERTVTVSGVSKSYAMCGWRIGYAAGPLHVLRAMYNIQSQQTSGACHISQYAALAALTGDQSVVESMRASYERRARLVVERLRRIAGLACLAPEGTFYAWVDVSSFFGRPIGSRPVNDSVSFCQACLDTARVALVPGAAFGADASVRLSFATGEDKLTAALDRLEAFLSPRSA